MKNMQGATRSIGGLVCEMVARLPLLRAWRGSLVLALSCVLATNGWAILIDFEDASGYHAGNLVGQPNAGTQWSGNANALTYAPLQIVAGQGVGGSNGLQVQPTAAANSSYRYAPSNADLGGTFLATSSVLTLSFDLRWDTVNTAAAVAIGRLYTGASSIGGNATVLSLDWYSNGRIGFNDGTFQYTLNSAGSIFTAQAGVYYNVTATIDYATKTYVLTLNGVTQKSGGSENISFRTPGGTLNNIMDVTTINNQAGTFQNWTIDNIIYALVPEPSASALVFGASLAFALILLRRKRSIR